MGNIGRLLLIRKGEHGDLGYFLLFFLLVSAGMAVGRGTADALFLKRLGIEYLPLIYTIQSIMLALVSLMYAAFADRIPAEKFFHFLFAALLLLVFGSWSVMTVASGTLVYPVYYLTYEVASELLLVHAALYMNQNMNVLQAKRLAPLVYAGAQLGTIGGGLLLAVAAPVLGVRNLLLVWCGLLLTGAFAIVIRHARHGTSTHFRAKKTSRRPLRDSIEQINQGIHFTWSSSLLRAASFALFFMVIAFYILCYSVNSIYTHTFETEADLTRFFGILTAVTSTSALLIQLFVTNRVIRRLGIRKVNLLFPWTTVTSLALLTFSFTLPVALIGSFNKDSLMPAIRNPVRSMFFNILPDYMQGRARAITVAIVLPLALMVCGIILILMQHLGSPAFFLVPGMLAAGMYLLYNKRMNRAYVDTLITTLKERLFLPENKMYSDLNGCNDDVLNEITAGVNHADPEVAITFAKVLTASFPEQAAAVILKRAQTAETDTQDQLMILLGALDVTTCSDELGALADRGDAHLKSTILRLMLDSGSTQALTEAAVLLDSANPRLRATAIHALLRHPDSGTGTDRIVSAWESLLGESNESRLAAMDISDDLHCLGTAQRQNLIKRYHAAISSLLGAGSAALTLRTLQGLSRWTVAAPEAIRSALQQALDSENPAEREAAARCLHLVAGNLREQLLLRAIGDAHKRVREAGIDTLRHVADSFDELALAWISGNRGSLRTQQALLGTLLDTTLPVSVFRKIVHSKLDEGRRLLDALHMLNREHGDPQGPGHTLLKYSLKERLDQTLDLVLLALEPLYEPGLIGIIRAGIISGDARHIASAREALDNLDNREPVAGLVDILRQSMQEDYGQGGSTFRNPKDVLDWCAGHSAEWLSLCGSRALQAEAAGNTHA
jgi:hypothetical protein